MKRMMNRRSFLTSAAVIIGSLGMTRELTDGKEVHPTLNIQESKKDNLSKATCPSKTLTFQNLVVGPCNRLAHAAALTVAKLPGEEYNPLIICGGTGSGKTHLLKAIGNQIAQNNPSFKVCYTTSENFTVELVNCLRDEKMFEFRSKYRGADVLLMDDIQFLEGRERTQEEFFHTLNALYDSGKQVVIAGDRLPKDLPGLEARLRSRMAWSLVADIEPLDKETKMAVLHKKADLKKISLTSDVTNLLANQLGTDIRQLEDAVTMLRAYSSLTGKEIGIAMAQKALLNIVSHHPGGAASFFPVGPGQLIDFQKYISQKKEFSCLKSSF